MGSDWGRSKLQETKKIGELNALCDPRLDSDPERDISKVPDKAG